MKVFFKSSRLVRAAASTFSAALLLACFSSRAGASVLINFSEVGSDVVATGSGSLDVNALTPIGSGANPSVILPSLAGLIINPGSTYVIYSGISGPGSWGAGSSVPADSATGDVFAIVGLQNDIALPLGYVSGTQLSDSATWSNASFASLGLTPGTYTYNFGRGVDADSITVQIGAAAPEPGTWMLITCGAVLLAAARRRKRA